LQRFTELKVWQRAHALVLRVYQLTDALPPEERYGPVSQLRRAAVSVPTNVAEGTKRETSADYARFLNIAEGSLAETEYLLMLIRDLGYAQSENLAVLLREIGEIASMLHSLRLKVQGREAGGVPA
jgi:four helix bundle protein